MKRKLISIILSLVLCLSLLPVPAWAAESTDYYDPTGKTPGPQNCEPVTEGDTTWATGWYVATGTVTIPGTVTVSGTVNLILADGCKLTVSNGIVIGVNQSLTIWGQSEN